MRNIGSTAIPNAMSDAPKSSGESPSLELEQPHGRLTRQRLSLLTVGLVAATVVIVVLAGVLVPAPHTFRFVLAVDNGQVRGQSMTFPRGSQVSGSFTATNPDAEIVFSIGTVLAGNVSDLVYQSRGPNSGSFSFTSAGTSYYFSAEAYFAATTVQVTGSY